MPFFKILLAFCIRTFDNCGGHTGADSTSKDQNMLAKHSQRTCEVDLKNAISNLNILSCEEKRVLEMLRTSLCVSSHISGSPVWAKNSTLHSTATDSLF